MYKTTLLIAFIIRELVKLQAINVISYQKLDFTPLKSGWHFSAGNAGCFFYFIAQLNGPESLAHSRATANVLFHI